MPGARRRPKRLNGHGRMGYGLPRVFPRLHPTRRGSVCCEGRYLRSEEHTSELQSLMRISYAVFCLKNKKDYRDILTQRQTLSSIDKTHSIKLYTYKNIKN